MTYIMFHTEFSSIYLPQAKKGQILITQKLFALKSQASLFPQEKSKFIENKKSKKKFQHMTLNFITKELYNDNIDFNINNLNNEDYKLPAKTNKRKDSCRLIKKKVGYFRNNSASNESSKNEKGRFSSISIKPINLEKPISLLQQKKFFRINNLHKHLRQSFLENLIYYQINGKEDKTTLSNKKIIQKIIAMIHENKVKKKINNSSLDYYELLKKIKGKENIEIILRTLIKEGEISLFNEYFHQNCKFIDINCKDEDGNSLLILSVKVGMNNISKILLEAGIDVNIQNNEGNSALHYALSGKNYVIADFLKKYGAREDLYNKYGLSPWDCVYRDDNN